MITFNCPKCGNVIRAENHRAGCTGTCNACGSPVVAPPMGVIEKQQKATRTYTPVHWGMGAAVGCFSGMLLILMAGWGLMLFLAAIGAGLDTP